MILFCDLFMGRVTTLVHKIGHFQNTGNIDMIIRVFHKNW